MALYLTRLSYTPETWARTIRIRRIGGLPGTKHRVGRHKVQR
jgi:hypothetical protein